MLSSEHLPHHEGMLLLQPVDRSVGAPPPVLVILGAMLATACAPAPSSESPPATTSADSIAALSTGDAGRLVDLTHPLSPDSLYWPTGAPFEHEQIGWSVNDAGYWYASGAFSSPEHLGTHLDAPIHFAEGGWTAAQIPPDRLVGAGVLIDITANAATDPDATLTVGDISAWEAAHGPIPAEAIVVVRTGWATRWPSWEEYYGTATPMDVATLHFPGVSSEAAAALASRGVAGVGIDTASIDPGADATFPAHRTLAARNIFNLENLTNINGLPESGFVVLAFPMKIADGSGGPARVVALVGSAP